MTQKKTWKLLEISGLFLAIVFILLQAWHPDWHLHMMVDGYFAYFNKIDHFLTYGSLKNIPFNEYQPGAVIYFLSIAPILLIEYSRTAFLLGLIISNLILIVIYAKFILKQNRLGSLSLLSLIIILGGPLILFRFELYSHLFIIAGLISWKNSKQKLSMFILGVATTIKIYPVLLIPLLIKNLVKKKKIKSLSTLFSFFTAGIATVLMLYTLIFRVPLTNIVDNLLMHKNKPLHIESISANLTIINTLVKGNQPQQQNSLIYGVSSNEFLVPEFVYLYFWIIPILLFYWWWYKQHSTSHLYLASMTVIQIFLISISQLGPQYLYWSLLFIPLINFPKFKKMKRYWIISGVLLSLSLILTQFTYPLFYSDLLSFFSDTSRNKGWISLNLRNLALLSSTLMLIIINLKAFSNEKNATIYE